MLAENKTYAEALAKAHAEFEESLMLEEKIKGIIDEVVIRNNNNEIVAIIPRDFYERQMTILKEKTMGDKIIEKSVKGEKEYIPLPKW